MRGTPREGEVKQHLLDLVRQGSHAARLGGIPRATLSKWTVAAGLRQPPRGKRPADLILCEIAKGLLAAGATHHEVRQHTGLSSDLIGTLASKLPRCKVRRRTYAVRVDLAHRREDLAVRVRLLPDYFAALAGLECAP